MKNMTVVILMMVLAQSAFASNGSLLDSALNDNLMQKQTIQKDHANLQGRPKAIRGDKSTAKYEVIEVGDEMGSFAAARHEVAPDNYAVEKKADAAKELKDINAEVSDSTL